MYIGYLQDRGDWKANGPRIEAEKTTPSKRGDWPKSYAAHDWLGVAKRAMCVSPGQQIARLKEDLIMGMDVELKVAKYREKQS